MYIYIFIDTQVSAQFIFRIKHSTAERIMRNKHIKRHINHILPQYRASQTLYNTYIYIICAIYHYICMIATMHKCKTYAQHKHLHLNFHIPLEHFCLPEASFNFYEHMEKYSTNRLFYRENSAQ